MHVHVIQEPLKIRAAGVIDIEPLVVEDIDRERNLPFREAIVKSDEKFAVVNSDLGDVALELAFPLVEVDQLQDRKNLRLGPALHLLISGLAVLLKIIVTRIHGLARNTFGTVEEESGRNPEGSSSFGRPKYRGKGRRRGR